jgi:hypothetical protein
MSGVITTHPFSILGEKKKLFSIIFMMYLAALLSGFRKSRYFIWIVKKKWI